MIQSKTAHILSVINQCIMTYVLSCFVWCSFSVGLPQAPSDAQILAGNLSIVIGTLISYFLYVKVDSLFLYIGGHILTGMLFLILLPPIPAYTNMVILAILMLVHIHESSKPETLPVLAPQAADFILFLIVYCLNYFSLHNDMVTALSTYGCVLSVIIFCSFRYSFQMDLFLQTNAVQEGYDFPMAQIRRNGRMMMGIFLMITILLMFLIPLSGLETLTGLLKEGALWLLVLLFRLLLGTGNTAPSDMPAVEETVAEEEAVKELVHQSVANMPQWLNVLIYIVFTIVIVCVLAVSMGFLIYALYCFLKSFAGHQKTDFVEKNYTETAQSIRPRRSEKRQREDISNPTAVVRKLYRHVIQKCRPKETIIPVSSTPEEVERLAKLQTDQPDTILFHKLYEKARYGKHGASKADADTMKSISRKKL